MSEQVSSIGIPKNQLNNILHLLVTTVFRIIPIVRISFFQLAYLLVNRIN